MIRRQNYLSKGDIDRCVYLNYTLTDKTTWAEITPKLLKQILA